MLLHFLLLAAAQDVPIEIPPEVLAACSGEAAAECEIDEIDLTSVMSVPIAGADWTTISSGTEARSSSGTYYTDFAYCRTDRLNAARRTEQAVDASFGRNLVERRKSETTSDSALQVFIGYAPAGGSGRYYYVGVDLSRVPPRYVSGPCRVVVRSIAWQNGAKERDAITRSIFADIREALRR